MNTTTTFRELFESVRKTIPYAVEGVILDFTEQVVARMQSLRLTRSKLAENLDSSPAYVSKVLSGGTNFTLESMVKFAVALDTDLKVELVPKASTEDWLQVIDKKFPAPRIDVDAWSQLMQVQSGRAREGLPLSGPPAPPELLFLNDAITTTA